MANQGKILRPIPGMAENLKTRTKKKDGLPQKPSNAVLYMRVSTPEQVKGHSLTDQLKHCRNFCVDNGLNILEIFEDEGTTGRIDNRRGFQAMIEYCKKNAKNIRAVVVSDLDRHFRNARHHLDYRNQLADLDIRLLSPNYVFKPRPDADEVYAAADAQRFSEKLSKQSTQFSQSTKEAGRLPYKAPIGYLNVRDVSRKRGTIVIHDHVAAPIIAEVFRLFAYTDRKRSDLKKWADRKGLVSAKNKKPISSGRFYKIFTNPVYMGAMYDKKNNRLIKTEFEGIVSRKIFDLAYEKATDGKRSSITHKTGAGDYPLKGAIRCPGCGRKLSGSAPNKGNYRYYHFYRHAPDCPHDGINVPAAKAEYAFLTMLKGISAKEPLYDLMAIIAQDWREDTRQEIQKNIQRLEADKDELNKLLEGLAKKFALDKLDGELYDKLRNESKSELASLVSEMDDLEEMSMPLDHFVNRAVWALEHLDLPWSFSPDDDKSRLAKALFPEGFTCDKKGNISLLDDEILFGLLSMKKPPK